jgi:hypothetical protein
MSSTSLSFSPSVWNAVIADKRRSIARGTPIWGGSLLVASMARLKRLTASRFADRPTALE